MHAHTYNECLGEMCLNSLVLSDSVVLNLRRSSPRFGEPQLTPCLGKTRSMCASPGADGSTRQETLLRNRGHWKSLTPFHPPNSPSAHTFLVKRLKHQPRFILEGVFIKETASRDFSREIALQRGWCWTSPQKVR